MGWGNCADRVESSHRLQHFLARAVWDHDAVGDRAVRWVAGQLSDDQAVLVVDETGNEKSSTAALSVTAAWQRIGAIPQAPEQRKPSLLSKEGDPRAPWNPRPPGPPAGLLSYPVAKNRSRNGASWRSAPAANPMKDQGSGRRHAGGSLGIVPAAFPN